MKLRDNDFHPLFMGEVDVATGGSTEVMDDVAGLGVVPPAEVFHFYSDFFQPFFGLFDLGLKSTVSQKEGAGMIEEDFH